MIGVLSGAGALQLTISVAAVMFFVAGASAFSRFRKLPHQPSSVDLADIDREYQKSKPRHAPPKGKEDFPIGSISFNELGELMIKLSHEILDNVRHAPYNASNTQNLKSSAS